MNNDSGQAQEGVSKKNFLSRLGEIKKRFALRATVNLLAIGVAVGLYLSSDQHKGTVLLNKDNMQSSIMAINSEVSSLETKIREAREAHVLWERLNQRERKGDGLEIDKAKEVLHDLEIQYPFPKPISVDLSTPIELANLYKTDNAVIVSSTVTLKFSGLSDEIILRFIESATSNLPGFVKPRSLNLLRQINLDDTVLAKISQHKEMPDVVTGEFVFEWQDFKYLKKTANDKPQ